MNAHMQAHVGAENHGGANSGLIMGGNVMTYHEVAECDMIWQNMT